MNSGKDKQQLGAEPFGPAKEDPACAASRVKIQAFWSANQSARMAVSLVLDGCADIDPDSTLFADAKLRAAIEHVSRCRACLHWRKSDLEPERYEWIARSQAHCCSEMFDAVHGAHAGLPIRFGWVGPESLLCWWVEPGRTVIRHCPWCGSSLTQWPRAGAGATDAA